jgi:hypothetical protein
MTILGDLLVTTKTASHSQAFPLSWCVLIQLVDGRNATLIWYLHQPDAHQGIYSKDEAWLVGLVPDTACKNRVAWK